MDNDTTFSLGGRTPFDRRSLVPRLVYLYAPPGHPRLTRLSLADPYSALFSACSFKRTTPRSARADAAEQLVG